MTTRTDSSQSQGDGGVPPATSTPTPAPTPGPRPPDHQRSRTGNMAFKSGPLFLSSKGIGWTSWKKRWFILTRTSLVFFRSDPNAVPLKGGEVNLTLGGIDLNNSGSVVVKEDKKLLTVLFPDGRDGRAFTLKAETTEDLLEWKAALESALAQAPSAALVVGQNGIFKNDQADPVDGSVEQGKDKQQPVISLVVGRPILLALEDIDGTPSFLEKALRFIEEHGVKVEGILRQAADVDDVEQRVREYEQGKIEFSPTEDPHIIGDCVKHVLRELPSSPVPAACCNALLEACRTDHGVRVTAMRAAIYETFPEPNRRLLQRILIMMQTVASHKAENRMSSSAVAACMAPLLLRPLLAGDCELEHDFDVGGDGSIQLLQAAAAANHAQAIVVTLLEEYDRIFGEGSITPDLYSDSEESGRESEEQSDYDDDDSFEDDEHDDAMDDRDEYTDDLENASSGTYSESHHSGDDDSYGDKSHETYSSDSEAPRVAHDLQATHNSSSSSSHRSTPKHDSLQRKMTCSKRDINSRGQANESGELVEDSPAETSAAYKFAGQTPSSCIQKSTSISSVPIHSRRHANFWGRTPGKKNLSLESIDYPIEEEAEMERLEDIKNDLEKKIAKEVNRNTILKESLEIRKGELYERRLVLEQDVARLQDQLQRERDMRMALEAGLKSPQGSFPISATIDEKIKADLKEVANAEKDVCNLKQKFDDLELQLNQQREQNLASFPLDSCILPQRNSNQHKKMNDKQKDREAPVISQIYEKSSRSKVHRDAHRDVGDSENDRTQEPSTLPSKHSPQTQQSEIANGSKISGVTANLSSSEPVFGKPPSATSKRSGTKGEGANSTSALTKLTTRLNFLKERRTQIANELQGFDKGRGTGQPTQNMEKARALSEPRSNSGAGIEGHLLETPEKYRKLEINLGRSQEKGRRADSPTVQHLERGRSEVQPFKSAERGRSAEAPSYVTPRTNSR